MSTTKSHPLDQWFSNLIIIGVLALVTWPVMWPKGRDSFPLSSYPMFARREAQPKVRLHYAYGIDGSGTRYTLSPSHVANHEVLQARAVLGRAVRGGPEQIDELCRHIATQVVADRSLGTVEGIVIVTGTHDAVDYLNGNPGPETERGRCEVER